MDHGRWKGIGPYTRGVLKQLEKKGGEEQEGEWRRYKINMENSLYKISMLHNAKQLTRCKVLQMRPCSAVNNSSMLQNVNNYKQGVKALADASMFSCQGPRD